MKIFLIKKDDEIGMQKDGFRLAYLEGIENDNKKVFSKRKEEIFEEICK